MDKRNKDLKKNTLRMRKEQKKKLRAFKQKK